MMAITMSISMRDTPFYVTLTLCSERFIDAKGGSDNKLFKWGLFLVRFHALPHGMAHAHPELRVYISLGRLAFQPF